MSTCATRGLNLSQALRILVGNRKAPTVRVFGTDRTGAGIMLFFDPRRGYGGTRSGAEEAEAGGGTRRRRAVSAIFAFLTGSPQSRGRQSLWQERVGR